MNKEFVRVRSILDYTISLALLIIGCAIVIIPTPASINIVGIFSIFAGILLIVILRSAWKDKETGERETDAFVEYAYDLPQVRRACEEAGLDILEICDGETFGELTPTSQRYCITAVKRSDKNCNAIYQSKENEAWED